MTKNEKASQLAKLIEMKVIRYNELKKKPILV